MLTTQPDALTHLRTIKDRLRHTYRDDALWAAIEALEALVLAPAEAEKGGACLWCGTCFTGKRPEARFCGKDACRKAYARKHGSIRPIAKDRRGPSQKTTKEIEP